MMDILRQFLAGQTPIGTPWAQVSGAAISPQAASSVGIGGMPSVAPGPTPYYGHRFNPASGKLDSPDLKSSGFLGPLTDPAGNQVTEYSLDDTIGGKNVQFPSVVPGLSGDQISRLLAASGAHQPVPNDIYKIAVAHAMKRINEGKSPFWSLFQDGVNGWK